MTLREPTIVKASANKFGVFEYHASPGVYQIECWGASGGEDRYNGGLGSYVSGIIKFNHFTKLFIYVGEQGKPNSKLRTFNGGGRCSPYNPSEPEKDFIFCHSGGGATDVRSINKSDIEGLKYRIIIAGAGGGVTLDSYKINGNNNPINGTGCHGGNLIGGDGSNSFHGIFDVAYTPAKGGTQKKGGSPGITSSTPDKNIENGESGSFGIGGNSSPNEYSLCGGGSGYFGGGGGSVSSSRHGSGAGGSSYVSGCDGCVSVSKDYSFENNNSFIGPVHYFGLSFKNIRMLSGEEQLPIFDLKYIMKWFNMLKFSKNRIQIIERNYFYTNVI